MIIIGLKNIGAVFGKSRFTAAKWIKKHGLVARRLPDKRWCTSLTFIDDWIAQGYRNDPLVKDRNPKPIRTRRKSPTRQHQGQPHEPVVHKADAD
jgi:hypothetical protein